MPVRFHGELAEIRWGYQLAVALGPWEISIDHGTPDEPTPVRRILQAQIRTVQPLAIRQRPLTLVIPRPHGPWLWPILELDLTSGAAFARLGPKEERPHVPIRPAGNGQAGSESR